MADTFFMLMPSEYRFYEILQKKISEFLRDYPLPIQLHEKIGVYPVVEQADLMYEMDCDYAQGFYYSRPRPYAELLDAE